MGERKQIFKDERWSLHGMTALVTGGSRGIGYAIVEELAEFGAAVHVCARNEEDINKCVEEWKNKGFSVTGSACDVSSPQQRQRLMETVSSIFHGKLNILINNAGTIIPKHAIDYSAEDMATIMSINFESAYHLCQLSYPLLKASGYGSIVFISSIAGLKALPFSSIYASTKGGMNQLAKNLALEWAMHNIRVNAVAPGYVRTKLLKDATDGDVGDNEFLSGVISRTPVGRLGESKEISLLAAFLCLSAASFITGQTLIADGDFTI
ncbi:hypothetical protein PIB30_036073 [Stylosanthes scabra]|uniref:Tropinone reductase I n=1 Tax=Stylosanthes scabra TaxID=79078 RepID=A0ABU6RDF0_9FABA|nr:hypothetical protein [Stylosanthes scabra]